MDKKLLTIDIGNTRLKWALWLNGFIESSGGCDHHGCFEASQFSECLPKKNNIDKVCVANVAGEKAEKALGDWISALRIKKTLMLKTERQCCGVTNAYSDPSQHGVDRWAALLGAREAYQGGVCVIDAGTAVTVDLMDAAGVHLGGLIMPGLEMMRRALHKDTVGVVVSGASKIDAINEFSVLLASNTEAAVCNGTLMLLRSGLQDVCEQASVLLGDEVKIVLTGGLAKQLMPLLKSPHIVYDSRLILKGLRLAADN